MTQVREHVRKGAALALLALAIQLAAGFGHVHWLHGPTEAAPVLDIQSSADRHDDPSDDHAGGECAVCAVLSLASSSILPDSPRLDLPTAMRAHVPHTLQASHRDARIAHFHARAPPLG